MDSINNEIYEASLIDLEKKYSRCKLYYEVLSRWMENDIYGNSICNYLNDKGITNIVIYGMGVLGKLLYKKIENTDINILYTLDSSIDNEKIQKFNTKTLNDATLDKDVDLVIITPLYAAKLIKKDLINFCYDGSKITTIDRLIFAL